MNVKQQIVLILIDKLVIGLLLGVTAYVASRALENYKKRQAVAGEIAKQRIMKISETWEHLDEWDFLIEEILRRLATLAIREHREGLRHLPGGLPQHTVKMTPATEVHDALEVLKTICNPPQKPGH